MSISVKWKMHWQRLLFLPEHIFLPQVLPGNKYPPHYQGPYILLSRGQYFTVHTLHCTIKKSHSFYEFQNFIAVLINFSHLILSLNAPSQPYRKHFFQSIPRVVPYFIAATQWNTCSFSLGTFDNHPAVTYLSSSHTPSISVLLSHGVLCNLVF